MEESSTNGVLFIDVEAKPSVGVVKEERVSSPDEPLSEVKQRAGRRSRALHCAYCHYCTYNTVRYTEHVNIHKGIKPYKCKHCAYRTVSKKYIKMHELKHGACDKCGFIAKNRPSLKKHMRENGCDAGEIKSLHPCQSCGNTYDSQVALKLHKKRAKKCEHCNQSFCSVALSSHLETEHGCNSVKKKHKFQCKLCEWGSSCPQKILLHFIHHPEQEISEGIDVTPLVTAGLIVR